MKRSTDDMQSCNFCKGVLMLIIVLYHSGLFWTGNWFTVIKPAEGSSIIDIFVRWMATFHIYAFTLISGYVYYYARYQRGGYNNGKKFIRNKFHRLIIPYLFVATLWVIPIGSIFFDYDASIIIKKYVLGISPSQLWFLLMLFGVFLISYPLSEIFRTRPKMSAVIVGLMWIIGKGLAKYMPDLFQISMSLQFMPFFWSGFELRRKWDKPHRHKTLNYYIIGGG